MTKSLTVSGNRLDAVQIPSSDLTSILLICWWSALTWLLFCNEMIFCNIARISSNSIVVGLILCELMLMWSIFETYVSLIVLRAMELRNVKEAVRILREKY
jgi:hypothetical protein